MIDNPREIAPGITLRNVRPDLDPEQHGRIYEIRCENSGRITIRKDSDDWARHENPDAADAWRPATVNWSAIGECRPDTAARFACALDMAARLADKLDRYPLSPEDELLAEMV